MVRSVLEGHALGTHPLPVGEAARLVWFAGVRSHGALRRGATIDRPGIRDTWDLLEPVAGILDEWPLRFVEWVVARGRNGARGGSLYEHHPLALDVLREFGGSCPAIPGALADAFAADASAPPIRTNSRFYREGAATLDSSGAARILGVAPPTVARRIGDGTLPGRVAGAGRRRAVAVSREHAVLASRAAVPPDNVASGFGLSRAQMAGLRTESGSSPKSKDDMERLVRQLDGRAGSGPPPKDAIALANVSSLRGPTLLTAVGLVMEGRLRCWSSAAHKPAFRRLLVSRSQLLREAGGGLSVREVAGCLRVPTRLVPLLVGAGCLEASGPPGRRPITRLAVARCAERYATAGEIAASARTNTRTLLARLEEAKVEPVIPSDPASGISSVWRRDEIEAVAGRLRPRRRRSR